MIKKIAYLSVIGLLTLSIISCEKDFTEVGSTIINNSKFSTKELIFDVTIGPQYKDPKPVRAGNTEIATLGEYLLGIYKKPNAQTLRAGIVSQLIVPKKASTPKLEKDESLSEPTLDEVILKIPVNAVLRNEKIIKKIKTSKGETKTIKVPDFRIDSILGNIKEEFTINIYRNETFLTKLDPNNPAKKRKYLSNESYSNSKKDRKLNLKSTISFENLTQDTSFIFNRSLSNGKVYEDTLKVANGKIKANPFIAIKLDKAELKKEIFDKFISSGFTQETFNEAFRGLIIEVEGTDGALIPLNLSSATLKPSVDFIYTNTVIKGGKPVVDDNGKIKTIEGNYHFYFGGIRTSTYAMNGSSSVSNGVILQGTAGATALIKILNQDTDKNGLTDLQELRKKNIIINDAKLIINVNTALDTTKTPKRLFLYKKEINKQSKFIPTHIGDLLSEEAKNFGGFLTLTNKQPDYYSFGIRKHLSDIIKGEIPNSDLILRVFNSNDLPSKETGLAIKEYNWNARSVPLLSNTTQQGAVRGIKLKISYTEEK